MGERFSTEHAGDERASGGGRGEGGERLSGEHAGHEGVCLDFFSIRMQGMRERGLMFSTDFFTEHAGDGRGRGPFSTISH